MAPTLGGYRSQWHPKSWIAKKIISFDKDGHYGIDNKSCVAIVLHSSFLLQVFKYSKLWLEGNRAINSRFQTFECKYI